MAFNKLDYKKKSSIAFLLFIFLLIAGFILPSTLIIPVEGASENDWNQDTFWYEPWGVSGVHKGIDIFADKGTAIISPTYGIVLYTGNINIGGNVAIVLAGKWRIHYFAHLDSIEATTGSLLSTAEPIGTVGDTGNARGKAHHLHYSIISLIPYPWNIDSDTQGWKKMFFLNPIHYFQQANS